MVFYDAKGTPWHSKEVHDDHVKKHASQHGGVETYLSEVQAAYQQVRNQQFGGFQSVGRNATIAYLGEQNNKHEYEIVITRSNGTVTKRRLILTDVDWSVVTYHKK